ncbi:MlaD family protein [Jongsikchunia kroppenstedtii]|uniref:MlaD family protein n=1 Tax=Jongsikchunia kroppenstedtii TaxID=1121721 RepID=UPI0003681627|nr:MlaD family protein [Jongsikchunia kroppenstedtii]
MSSFRKSLAFLCIFIVAVIAITYVIASAIERPVSGATDTYHARFYDAFGLRSGADVRLDGVQVGKVKDVTVADDGVQARVTFTVQRSHRLGDGQSVAIRFQNLVGQRYVSIVDRQAVPGCEPAVQTAADIPACWTMSSLDLTTLFNGLRPLLREVNPDLFNQLGLHVQAFLEGQQDDGLTSVANDITTLIKYAGDRDQVINQILINLQQVSKQMLGQTASIKSLLDAVSNMFVTLRPATPGLVTLMSTGLGPLGQLGGLFDNLDRLLVGGTDNTKQRFQQLYDHLDVEPVLAAIRKLPSVVDGVMGMLGPMNLVGKCRNGTEPLPRELTMLIDMRAVTLCNP